MTAPHIVDPERLLHEALGQASPDLLGHLLQTTINALLSADADAVAGAEYGKPSEHWTAQRNGYRHRRLDTRAGTIDVAIPKLRSGTCFPDWLLEQRKRAESALITVVADCYLAGVSTRRMDKLVRQLGIDSLSKSQVSRMAQELDEHIEAFRHRPLAEAGPFVFLAADALTMKVREGGRVVNAVAMVATGVNADGQPEVLGLKVATTETGAAWNEFFADLVAHGAGRGETGEFGLSPRPRGSSGGEPARGSLATLPHPLRGESDGRDPKEHVAGGEGHVAQRV